MRSGSRSAAIVSVSPEEETVRFLSHLDGSRPSAFSCSMLLSVEPFEPGEPEDDICLEMSIDFQPGPSSVGIWM